MMKALKAFIPILLIIIGALVLVLFGINEVPVGTAFFQTLDDMRIWGWAGLAIMGYGVYYGFRR